jgi:SHS family lactate transporter-like MFS transporter
LRAFGIALLGLSFANLDHSLFALVLTQIKDEFGWTDTERGLYLCLTFVIAGVLITQIGVLADRFGRKRLLLWSMLLTPIFVVSMYWAASTAVLLTLRVLGFAAAGAQSPLTGTLVIEESPPRYRGLMSGVLQIGYPLGWAMAALLFVPLVWDARAEPDGWRKVFLLAALGLPAAWLFWRYLREPPAWREARALATPAGTALLFSRPHRFRTIVLFAGQFMQVFAYGATILLVAYFQEARGWSFAQAARIVGLSYLVGSLGYVLAAVVGEFWLRRRTVIIAWVWLGAIAFSGTIWLAEGFAATTLWFCATTFFFYGATAAIFTFTAESFPAALRATAVSFSGSLGVNLGIAFGPLATALIVERSGWQWAFTIAGVLPLLIAGTAYLLAPHPMTEDARRA